MRENHPLDIQKGMHVLDRLCFSTVADLRGLERVFDPRLVEAQKLGYGLIGVFLNGGVGGLLTHFQYVTNRGVDSSPRVARRAFDFPICHVCVHFFFRFLCAWDEDQCVIWDSY